MGVSRSTKKQTVPANPSYKLKGRSGASSTLAKELEFRNSANFTARYR